MCLVLLGLNENAWCIFSSYSVIKTAYMREIPTPIKLYIYCQKRTRALTLNKINITWPKGWVSKKSKFDNYLRANILASAVVYILLIVVFPVSFC